MKDETLSGSLAASFEDIKELMKTGDTEVVYQEYLNLLAETAAPDIVDSFISFVEYSYSKEQAFATLIDTSGYHYSSGCFERAALTLKGVVQSVADDAGLPLEAMASYQFLSSAVTSLPNQEQFITLLNECLQEPEFSTGVLVTESTQKLLGMLGGTPPVAAPEETPKTTNQPITQEPLPTSEPQTAPPKEDLNQLHQAGGHGFFGSLDEPIKPISKKTSDAPLSNPVGLDAPLSSPAGLDTPLSGAAGLDTPLSGAAGLDTPLSGAAGLDTPLSGADAGSSPPSNFTNAPMAAGFDTPLAGGFDAPLPSSQKQELTQNQQLVEKLEKDIAMLIANNQLQEAIAFCHEIVTLAPGRADIKKKIQFLETQILSQKSQEGAKSLVKIVVFIVLLIFGGIGGYSFLGMQHANKLHDEFKSVFTAKDAPKKIAKARLEIEKIDDLVKAYKKYEELKSNNPYLGFEDLQDKATKYGFTYHMHLLGIELKKLETDGRTYKTILEEILSAHKLKADTFFHEKKQMGEKLRKDLNIESYNKALKIYEEAHLVATATKDEENATYFGTGKESCEKMVASLLKKKQQREKELQSRREEAKALLTSMEQAIAAKDFQKAFSEGKKIVQNPKLLMLEECFNVKIPIGLKLFPEDIIVVVDDVSLGKTDHVFFPHQSSKIELKFSRQGYKTQTKTLFKQDIQPWFEIKLERGELWTFDTKGPIEAPIQIRNNRLYIANRNARFFAIDLETGNSLWDLKVSETLSDIKLPFTISGERAFCTATDKRVYGIDLNTEELAWKKPPLFRKSLYSSPCAISNDIVCVGFHNSLVFMSAKSGKVVTSWEISNLIETTPTEYNGSLYFSDIKKGYYRLSSSSLSKKKLLRKKKKTLKPRFQLKGKAITAPVIEENLHYLSLNNATLVCLEEKGNSFTLKWTFQAAENMYSPPLLDGKQLYICSADKEVYCLNSATGTVVWNFSTKEPLRNSVAIDSKAVYIAGADKTLYCVSKDKGELLWQTTFKLPLENTPLCYKNLVIICDKNGVVRAMIKE